MVALTVAPGAASVFRELREVPLGRSIPVHPGDGMLPAALHLLEGSGVRVIAVGHHVLQMTILGLDHSVSGIGLELMVARSTQLLTCHRLHSLIPPYALS